MVLTKRERYAFVVMIVWSVIVGIIAVQVSLWNIRKSDLRFCAVVTSVSSYPMQKPGGPPGKVPPTRERQYESYLRFVALAQGLGCKGDEYKLVAR